MIGHPMATPDFDVGAWVRSSCEAQGLPAKVTDPEAVRRVGHLLGASESGPRLVRQHGRGPTRQDQGAAEQPYSLQIEDPARQPADAETWPLASGQD